MIKQVVHVNSLLWYVDVVIDLKHWLISVCVILVIAIYFNIGHNISIVIIHSQITVPDEEMPQHQPQ